MAEKKERSPGTVHTIGTKLTKNLLHLKNVTGCQTNNEFYGLIRNEAGVSKGTMVPLLTGTNFNTTDVKILEDIAKFATNRLNYNVTFEDLLHKDLSVRWFDEGSDTQR